MQSRKSNALMYLPGQSTVIPVPSQLLIGGHSALNQRLKSGAVFDECHSDLADRTVALLGDNDLGFALDVGIVLLVDLFAEDEHYEVGILLDRTGFTQV